MERLKWPKDGRMAQNNELLAGGGIPHPRSVIGTGREYLGAIRRVAHDEDCAGPMVKLVYRAIRWSIRLIELQRFTSENMLNDSTLKIIY